MEEEIETMLELEDGEGRGESVFWTWHDQCTDELTVLCLIGSSHSINMAVHIPAGRSTDCTDLPGSKR